MSKKIWNEGRVVGYSSYEMYVKNFLERYPDQVPASERQWTASMLGMGASMLVKVTGNAGSNQSTQPTIIDIPLPEHSMLCACSTIVANLFLGEGVYEGDSKWAKRVKSYGPLMANNSSTPSVSSKDMPIGTHHDTYNKPEAANFDSNWRKKMTNYLKIIDGVVLQPGYWIATQTNDSDKNKNNPPKDMRPDLSKPSLEEEKRGKKRSPTVRLLLSHALTCDIEILLTGFVNMKVVDGSVALDGSTLDSFDYDSAIEQGIPRVPDNDSGDFLGPAEFPWATKIMFSVPNEAFNYLNLQKLNRSIDGEDTNDAKEIQQQPIIDFSSAYFSSYYSKYKNSRVPVTINDTTTLNGTSSVLTAFSKRKSEDPPALWGYKAITVGTGDDSHVENFLHPLTVVAPGTVRMWRDASQSTLSNYQKTYPGTYGLSLGSDGTISTLTSSGKIIKAGDLEVYHITYDPTGIAEYVNRHGVPIISEYYSKKATLTRIETGIHKSIVLSMCEEQDDSQVSGSSPKQWIIGKSYEELICKDKRSYRDGTTFNTSALHTIIPYSGELSWDILLQALANNLSIDLLGPELRALKVGLASNPPYIPFSNGLRLYVSKTAPTDVDIPENSIGLGW